MADLDAAIKTRDASRVRSAAHTVEGTGGFFGAAGTWARTRPALTRSALTRSALTRGLTPPARRPTGDPTEQIGPPVAARVGSRVRPVEVVLGGVGHPRHLAREVAGLGGGLAA